MAGVSLVRNIGTCRAGAGNGNDTLLVIGDGIVSAVHDENRVAGIRKVGCFFL